MSIYASAWGVDADEHAERCRRRRGKSCTCGAGPVAYHASHLLPDADSPRAGSVDVAEIPGWIDRPGKPALDPEETGERVWPWLRWWIAGGPTDLPPGHGVVLLDRDQVVDLHEYLGRWLERSGTEGDS